MRACRSQRIAEQDVARRSRLINLRARLLHSGHRGGGLTLLVGELRRIEPRV